MAPLTRAGGDVDHRAAAIEFVHPTLGATPVTVSQNAGEEVCEGRDATARWVWDGASPMAMFLCEHPECVAGKTVVELGCGPGLPGIVAGRLGAKCVVLTDLPSELELPEANFINNNLSGEQCSVAPCAWGDDEHCDALGTFNVVLCSDVLYGHHAEVASALARTAHKLCEPESGTVLLSYFPREKLEADQPFFRACEVLFNDPTPRTVHGCPENVAHDLWFFEYTPKRVA
tara:strand:- start:526 stop:1218 length:693 start_codon:yes stop_codon:yes gene_type:complete